MLSQRRVQGAGRSAVDVEYVLEELRAGRSIAVQAYPGWGKTRLAASVVDSLHSAVVAARTHNEVFEVYSFLSDRRGVAYAYGKQAVCYRLERFSYGLCRVLEAGSCNTSFTRRDAAWVAATLRRPGEVVEYERERGVCLHRAFHAVAAKSRKLLATYDYLASHPSVLERGREAYIFDEAHALLEHLEALVVSVNEAYIEAVVERLKAEGERGLAYAVRAAWRKSSSAREFVGRLDAILSSSGAGPQAAGELSAIVDAFYSGRCHASGKNIYCLSSALPRLAELSPRLMLSAYLPEFLSAAADDVVVVEPPEPLVRAYIDAELTTRYEERSPELVKRLAAKVRQYLSHEVGNLVVFPSKELMEKALAEAGVQPRTVEPGQRVWPGEVVADVAGGRLSEGVNILGVGNVVVAGMPFPQPSPLLDALSKRYGFEGSYAYVALLRTLQAVGRIRGRGTAYLVDARFERYADRLPPWVSVGGRPL